MKSKRSLAEDELIRDMDDFNLRNYAEKEIYKKGWSVTRDEYWCSHARGKLLFSTSTSSSAYKGIGYRARAVSTFGRFDITLRHEENPSESRLFWRTVPLQGSIEMEGKLIAQVRILDENPKLFIIGKISSEGPVLSLSWNKERDLTKPCLLSLNGLEYARLTRYRPSESGPNKSILKSIRINKFDLGTFTKAVASADAKTMCVIFAVVQIYDAVILHHYMDSPSS